MALLDLYAGRRDYPKGPMYVAAISELLSNVLGGVEDWKRRKLEQEQEKWERDYARDKLALDEAASKRADIALQEQVAPMPETDYRRIMAVPEGPLLHEGAIPSYSEMGDILDLEKRRSG